MNSLTLAALIDALKARQAKRDGWMALIARTAAANYTRIDKRAPAKC